MAPGRGQAPEAGAALRRATWSDGRHPKPAPAPGKSGGWGSLPRGRGILEPEQEGSRSERADCHRGRRLGNPWPRPQAEEGEGRAQGGGAVEQVGTLTLQEREEATRQFPHGPE